MVGAFLRLERDHSLRIKIIKILCEHTSASSHHPLNTVKYLEFSWDLRKEQPNEVTGVAIGVATRWFLRGAEVPHCSDSGQLLIQGVDALSCSVKDVPFGEPLLCAESVGKGLKPD